MKKLMFGLVGVAAVMAGAARGETWDLVIYGSSPAALSAAVQAKRMGKSAVIVSPETRIGGLTTGGLGQTDIGNKRAFGGLALQFYRDIAAYYADPARWTRERPEDYFPDGQCSGTKDRESMWTFEPSAALAVLEGWEKKFGLDIRRGEYLERKSGVEVEGGKIKSIKTLGGNVYRGRMFVDATYEGDLMAAAGVSYTVGREDNSVYGETISGRQCALALYHQFAPGVDPYVRKGDKSSGLLPGVLPAFDVPDGTGDRCVQAYCFRMCLTDVPENRIPFKKPANYRELDYELLFREFEQTIRHPELTNVGNLTVGNLMPAIMSRMPNRKTDSNNRSAFSTDFIGRNWAWPEASYAERERMLKEHLDYQQGLMWTLANHPRVPKKVRDFFSKYGTCRDEFTDGLGDGWQRQLYVREARRMVGDYVMTEHNCRGKAVAKRPVAMAAYGMDSHNAVRAVGADGFVHNEGDIQDWTSGGKPYPIDYGALVPKRGECANLFVPVCLSASHMAFGSIRMEPVFFALGQVAGTAAALAADAGVAVQDVDYPRLAQRLRADGQVLDCTTDEQEARRAAIGEKRLKMKWWTDARFGMFIHFGLYAMPARHEWIKMKERMDDAAYDRYFERFNPDLFDAKEWARRAKAAGMKYAVLTTKHHEGFCLFDSKHTDYKSTNTPCGRDLVREFVDAFRAEGLRVGFYYSLLDWHHPDFLVDEFHPRRPKDPEKMAPADLEAYYAKVNAGRDMGRYRQYMKDQVTELLSNYGTIDIIWFDFSYPKHQPYHRGKDHNDWDSKGLLELTRRLQPNIIVDNRLDLPDVDWGWDFLTPEQYKVAAWPKWKGIEAPWETCQTFSGSWGYHRDENTWKTMPQLVELLVHSVANGGNLIMNVGPTARGEFDARACDRLDGFAKWMHANSRAIYGCTRAPSSLAAPEGTALTWNPATWRVYVHLLNYPLGQLTVPFGDRVAYAQFLHDGSELKFRSMTRGCKEDGDLRTDWKIDLPVIRPDVTIPVIELELK